MGRTATWSGFGTIFFQPRAAKENPIFIETKKQLTIINGARSSPLHMLFSAISFGVNRRGVMSSC
jgi:hypothetical protein